MKHHHFVAATLLSLLVAAASPADSSPPGDEDHDAIRRAALDYVDGYYSGDVERVERGVHPSLQKVLVQRMPWGTDSLQGMDRHTLLEYTRFGGEKRPAAERGIEVSCLAVSGNIATVRIDSAEFLDYGHVAKINGEWRLINVLWAPHAPGGAAKLGEEDLAAIRQVGLDYVDGFYAGSAEHIGKALHPRLQKLVVRKLPNGREFFHYATADSLVEYTRTGQGKKPAEERHVEVTIHATFANIATIEIDSVDFLDYAHAAKIDGEWKIVNVLWAPKEK